MGQLDEVAFVNNGQPRCACVFLLDTSASMTGAPIDALNQGLRLFYQDIRRDQLASARVEVAIVTFGNQDVQLIQNFSILDTTIMEQNLEAPPEAPILVAGGLTPMGKAINFALDLLQERKRVYNEKGAPYYRPWVLLITDGAPTDNWKVAAQRVHNEEQGKGVTFFAIGVGEEADLQILSQISVRQPVRLQGLKFAELFLWLSNSQKRVSASRIGEKTALPPTDSWSSVSV